MLSDDFEEHHTTQAPIEDQKVINRSRRAMMAPDEDSPRVPYEVFNVVKGQRYRFRHINAGFLNCPIEMSIDNHTITVIASDGNSIQSIEATFLVTYAGERWEVGNYFIRTRGLMDFDSHRLFKWQFCTIKEQLMKILQDRLDTT